MKSKKQRHFLLFGFLFAFCGLSICFGIFIWNYIDLYLVPFQPTTTGSFPNEADWIFSAEEEISSTPVVTDTLAILRTPNSILAIDVRNGNKVWETQSFIPRYPNSDITIAPIIAGDMVIAPEEYSTLSAFSISTGERLWKSQQILANPQDLHLYDIESYTVNGNKLYVARSSWALSAYDLISGNLLWEDDLPNRSSPIVRADDKCVYLNVDGLVQCIDPTTGNQVWEIDLDAPISQMYLDSGVLYIAITNSPTGLVALNLDTLQSNWSITSDDLHEDELFTIISKGDYLSVVLQI